MLDSLDGFALALAAERRSPHTVRQYGICVRKLTEFLATRGITSWDQVTRQAVNAFMAEQARKSPASHAGYHYAIKAFSAYLVEYEDLAAPLLSGKGPKVPFVPPAFPRESNVRKLVAQAKDRPRTRPGDQLLAVRNEAILRLMADAGLRLAEVTGLRTDDLELTALPRVRVLGKGSKVRYVAIGSKTALALRRYIKERRAHKHAGSPMLWLGARGPLSDKAVYWMVRHASKDAGAPTHPHALRHSWAHHFSASGGQFNDLVHLGGWARADTAMRYGASAAGELAEAHARQLSMGDRL